MPLKRHSYTVFVRVDESEEHPEGYATHDIDVTHQDRLRAETEAATKRAVSMTIVDGPMTWSTLWIWCALTRLGLYDGAWQQFRTTDCLDFEKAGGDDEDVDPTKPAVTTDSP